MATSTLNPNAPIFVPSAYRMVDDFSDQWWDLVRSSPSFRDYWLRECFSDPQNDALFADTYDSILPDFDFDFDFILSGDTITPVSSKEEEKDGMHLVSSGVLKWQKTRVDAEVPRYAEKAPKIVKGKVGPRMIQQPR